MLSKERLNRILGLSLPIIGAMISQNVLNLVDTAMVGTLGNAALAAVGLGGFALFMFQALILGISTGVQATSSRRKGEGRFDRLAVPLNAALLIVLLAAPVLSAFWYFLTPYIYPYLIADPEVIEQGVPYLQVRTLAIIFVGMNYSFRGYWNAVDHARLYMSTLVVMHGLNIFLNYVLIFGHFGAPALGVYGASVITALTAQNTREVRAIHDAPPEFIAQQIDAVFDDIRIDAVKIGMLSRPEVIEVVAAGLERHRVTRMVLDPVMVAKSGDRLLAPEAVAALRERLLPLATLVTPNLPEAAVLLGEDTMVDETEMADACRRLLALGPEWVLLKGGHLKGPESTDLLMGDEKSRRLSAPRIATANTNGTGCTLSSAITAGLAQGLDVIEATARAKDYVTAALKAADRLDVGAGHGPVHHFHGNW